MGTNGLLPDGTIPTEDNLKDIFRQNGIPIGKPKRTEPFGNEDCICGSGLRYDMCCSKNKMRVV